MDVTPESTLEMLKEKDYLSALVMSFRLNERYLIHQVYESIPVVDIKLVANNIPVVYVERLLNFISSIAMTSPHIEFNLIWIKAIISAHGKYINTHKHEFASALRGAQRFIARIAKHIVRTSKDNEYSYLFLSTTGTSEVDEEVDEDNIIVDASGDENSDSDIDQDEEADEDGGWFDSEKTQKYNNDSDEDSDDEELD
ncbi:unnamed protein product [Wickerhamomyces anomalus]